MDLDNIEVSHSQRRMSTISQLCTNALRKTRSQDKVAFWRLLTSSRQSRPQASKRRKRHQASHGCILQASPSVTKRRKRHQEGCVQASQGCRDAISQHHKTDKCKHLARASSERGPRDALVEAVTSTRVQIL